MDVYADYGYYAGAYGGTLPEHLFEKWAARASAYIDRITFGRIGRLGSVPEGVKRACCEMCDAFQKREAAKVDGKDVQSVNNAGYSVTFSQNGGADPELHDLYEIAYLHIPPELMSMWAYEGACNG